MEQGIAIIAALEKDLSHFETRVNSFFRLVATANIQSDTSATQSYEINHMTASIISKDEEIGTSFILNDF